MTIGQRIANARKAKGWTQKQLAEQMGYADHGQISRLENGHHTNTEPSSRVMMALERALGVKLVK